MEDNIINEENQTTMPWVDFETVLTSFSNNEQLNNIQIDFIKRIANEITYNVNVNNWRNLITDCKIGLPRREPKYDNETDNQYNAKIRNKVNATKLSNKDILSYTGQYSWIQCLDDIHHTSNSSSKCWDDYKKKIDNYITFIQKIKDCYITNHISKDKCVSLLNWLLYNNVYNLFLPFRTRNGITTLLPKYKTFDDKFADYLLKNNKNISLKSLHYGIPSWKCTSDENIEYNYMLQGINKIIDNLIPLHISDNIRLSQNVPTDLIRNIRERILEPILHGICDALFHNNNGNNILNSQLAINKIDTEFNITKKISSSPEYKENYDNFKTYYQLLRREKGSVGQYKSLTNVKQSIKDIMTIKNNEKKQEEKTKDIKENKVIKSNENIIKNNNNEPAMPEIIYSNILPFLVHTNRDRKSNTNSQTQNNQLHNNINEINTNIKNNEGND